MDALLKRGDAFFNQGQYHEAMDMYRQATRAAPKNPQPHLQLGRAYAAMGEHDKAIGALQRVIQLQRRSYLAISAHRELAAIYGRLGQWTKAVAALQQADQLRPNDHETLHPLGMAYMQADRLDEASSALTKALPLAKAAGRPQMVAEIEAMLGFLPLPKMYRLAVRAEPSDSRIRILNGPQYQPGVALHPGSYQIQVDKPGYHPRRQRIDIVDRDVTLEVRLTPVPVGPTLYALTVDATPRDSEIRILNGPRYQRGVPLEPGSYEIQVRKPGYRSHRQWIKIVDRDERLEVRLSLTTYALTVDATPQDSEIRILNGPRYQRGVPLEPGSYEIEVHKPGYQPQRQRIDIVNRDVRLEVRLAPAPPTTYALAVDATPRDSLIRILNGPQYQRGVRLEPGSYEIEVHKPGYQPRRERIDIVNRDVRLEVRLSLATYALTVDATPQDSEIRILNGPRYQRGVRLEPGSYVIQVSNPGYEPQRLRIDIVDRDVRLEVSLRQAMYALRVEATPPQSQVSLTDAAGGDVPYRPGMLLKPGPYTVRVTHTGYQLHEKKITVRDEDIALEVALSEVELARRALLIGNANYKQAPLRNPRNDAQDMAKALKTLGFQVDLLVDASHREMVSHIETFTKHLRQGGVGLFYYAGHGVQIDGLNYLMPLGEFNDAADVKFNSVELGWVLAKMDEAKNRLNIVVLDACRNNPFVSASRSSRGGLATVDAATGTFIAYATAPGDVALDGDGRNGVYTEQLLRHITSPGLTVETMFKAVRAGVYKETQGQQVPWDSSSLLRDFYFVKK